MPDNLNHFQQLEAMVGVSVASSVISFLLKVQEGKKFSFFEFILHISFSALFGAIAFEIMYQEGIPFHWAGAICGMSGWLGTRVIRIAQIILAKKFGVSQEVFKDIDR